MKRSKKTKSLDTKTVTFVVAVGGLKLFGLVLGAVQPHLGDGAAVGLEATAAAAVVAPLPEARRGFGGGGKTGDTSAHHMPRVRLNSDRRDGSPTESVTVQVTSSSR